MKTNQRQNKKLKPEPELTPNAKTVLEKRYLWKDESGQVCETPRQLFERVAQAIATSEKKERTRWSEKFFDFMLAHRFIPNSPTLMNAGKDQGQLSACFVLPVGDSLDEIFDSLKYAAKIHQSGGGTGFSFSHLRPRGSLVRTTHGVASGPVSFLKVFDLSTETIKQGGARRGANMGVLRVDHPDIFEFIDVKRDLKSVLNFNLSVGATDEFMVAVQKGDKFPIRNPKTGKESRQVQARELFDRIAQAAWECGDPGLIFLDRINEFNPTPKLGPIESTNPCGEQPLLPYESCNLGSLNLGKYIFDKDLNWELLKEDVWLAVRFLDDVIEANHFPVENCAKITIKNRKIGLGVMGFADLLLSLGIPYESLPAFQLGEKVMMFVDKEGKKASAFLAKERGAFPNWRGSRWQKQGFRPLRNATVTTVAPTGTISMIAGCSSGIEPIFSGNFYRNVLSGERLMEIHPAVEKALRARGVTQAAIADEKIGEWLGPAWQPARRVSVEGHIEMQAVFQRHCDSAVSKTVNLPGQATPADIAKAYLLAFEKGCKGITVYRDRSRGAQVLEAIEPCSEC